MRKNIGKEVAYKAYLDQKQQDFRSDHTPHKNESSMN